MNRVKQWLLKEPSEFSRRYWIVWFMLTPLLAMNLVVFLLEPHLYIHVTPKMHWRMQGEKEAVLFLDVFYVWLAAAMAVMISGDVKREEKDVQNTDKN